MEIFQEDDDRKGVFKAVENGTVAGEMTYVWVGTGKFIIDHTEVDPRFDGKGIGKQLLMAAVEFARGRKVSILPLCPFAKAMFEKNRDISDVL